MSAVPLPDEPNFDQLRTQARDLQRAVRSGDPDALAEVVDAGLTVEIDPGAAGFQLSRAQLVVARRYGFTSWARLKRHVEVIQRYSRFPDRLVAGEPLDLADRFLRMACLTYEDGGPAQWAEARTLLGEHPEIADGNIYTAAIVGDTNSLRRILDADPGAADREGGPYRWTPLVYLAYARQDPTISRDAVIGATDLLLEAGADPNAGFLWHGLPSPFTVLTGVFGEGEAGPVRQPRHPHSLALGRVLLEAGADPNDAQALYNRMFRADNDHLELLLEFGLGAGSGGPWRTRLGDTLEPPAVLLRRQLAWAIVHGMSERVHLLADHGVDLVTPYERHAWHAAGTPAELAATTGHPELVEYLVNCGAPRPNLAPNDAFIAAVLANDQASIEQLRLDHPDLPERVRASRPGLTVWAAANGRPGAVELLVDLGFDVNAKGRSDVPANQPWHTALHAAVEHGDLELAQTLLRLGADPTVTDQRFDATPLEWAHHAGSQQLVDLLEPLTPPPPVGDGGSTSEPAR